MFRKIPLTLLLIITIILILDPFMPLILKRFLYSISLSIKTLIIFLLPIIIFGLLFKSAIILARDATIIISTIILLVCCSNFITSFWSHYIGIWIYNFDLSIINPKTKESLTPLWVVKLPVLISNAKSMFAGIIFGILCTKINLNFTSTIATNTDFIVNKILALFIYLIPLFVIGFVIKLLYDGLMWTIIKDYTLIISIIGLTQLVYITLLYYLFNKFNIEKCLENIKNMLPAGISGFTTMSSAASIPLTIMGLEASTKNKDIIRSVIPATVNIHLIGDCIAIPIFAYAVLKSFGIPEPLTGDYIIFAFYFVLAKFSVAAIPGGGIIVMLPILQHYLAFNAEMMSLITALYILFDPVITCSNIMGNGAFAKMIDNLTNKFFKNFKSSRTH